MDDDGRITEEAAPRGATTLAPPSTPALVEVGASSVSAQEHTANMLRFRVGLGLGIFIYLTFAVVDVFAVSFVSVGARLWVLLGLRAIGLTVACMLWWRLRQSPPLGPRAFRAYDLTTYSFVAVSITAMAIELDGLKSLYMCGITTLLVVRGATQPEHWRRGLVSLGVPFGAHLATALVAVLTSEVTRQQLHDSSALASYALTTAFTLAATVFIVAGGNAAWELRQQVFEARRLGRYRLIQPIGSGGMGQVWIASHNTLRRNVAVKVLRTQQTHDPLLAAARFEREVRATTELSHPNTVRIFDYGVTDDGVAYYAMELLLGQNLRTVVGRDGVFSSARAIHVVKQVCRSLVEAHSFGIIHRDIKPENIILCEIGGARDFVKVIDFGIAHLKSATDETLTKTGMAIGTPGFMAPEVRAGLGADERADVYSVGCLLYFLCRGEPPPERPAALNDALQGLDEAHAALRAVLERSLSQDPERRHQSMALLLSALEGGQTDLREMSSMFPRSNLTSSAMPS